MSRADRRRSAREKPDARPAAPARRRQPTVGEETLFFERLRRQAKWIFVLLAALFAVTFVGFGVGSSVPGGVADLLQGAGGPTGVPDLDDARERVRENPKDAKAQRDLAEAYQARGDTEGAIKPLVAYTKLRPKDEDAIRQLATLYMARALRLRTQAQIAQAEAQLATPHALFAPPASTPFGQALGQPPIYEALSSLHNERLTQAYSDMSKAYEDAQATYERVAALSPEDPDIQLQLADASLNAGDQARAIEAYKRFLKIDPDNASAPLVRQQLQQLQAQARAPAATG